MKPEISQKVLALVGSLQLKGKSKTHECDTFHGAMFFRDCNFIRGFFVACARDKEDLTRGQISDKLLKFTLPGGDPRMGDDGKDVNFKLKLSKSGQWEGTWKITRARQGSVRIVVTEVGKDFFPNL